jgi:hypothetical protein
MGSTVVRPSVTFISTDKAARELKLLGLLYKVSAQKYCLGLSLMGLMVICTCGQLPNPTKVPYSKYKMLYRSEILC